MSIESISNLLTSDQSGVQTVAALALRSALPQVADDGAEIPFVIVPDGHSVASLEHLLPQPTRARHQVVVRDVAGFCEVVDAFSREDTRLYGSRTPPVFTAVFDDTPGWREHRARYICPISIEWETWTKHNKNTMSQASFAQFIEDNAPDCVTPDAATMIEISRTLEAKKKVNFASGIRLSDGQNELTYEEEITGTASKGKIKLPEVFTIGISVLDGGPKYAVNARLRYRIGDKGALVIWYDLERPHKVMEDAVKGVWSEIETRAGMTIINGDA